MEYGLLVLIGLLMGVAGGMLGIGGSIVMIPAMSFVFGENQQLYQSSAMICNFFVACSAMIAHRKAGIAVKDVWKFLIPLAMVFVVAGVFLSNMRIFSGENSYILCRVFGYFMVYVIIYNCVKLYHSLKSDDVANGISEYVIKNKERTNVLSMAIGAITGIFAGLLGIGAGGVSTPLQQQLLKMPLKNAMANSSAAIIFIAAVGAVFKNLTLGQHNVSFDLFGGTSYILSIKIAAMIIPSAIVGGFIGGRLMHILPKNVVRGAFIIVLILSAVKLLTIR